ncbi:hypothetical protein [Nonomuraea sp. GTA35]|uniref:hypothetical protein n=1 Tax=Nonomuraea sp. GTA35 TaxID=1676746 RepID=UPI0035BEBE02
MRKLVEAGPAHPDSLTVSSTDMQPHFHNGTVASVQDGFGAMAAAGCAHDATGRALGPLRL